VTNGTGGVMNATRVRRIAKKAPERLYGGAVGR
jgi:hypothetical protein